MSTKKLRMELQVRQNSNDVPSNDAENVSNVTVVNDDFHPNQLKPYSEWRVYLRDDHDVALDVELQHVNSEDKDFSHPTTDATVSLASGSDNGTTTIVGPLGRLRFVVLASSAASVPSSGSLTVEAIGVS